MKLAIVAALAAIALAACGEKEVSFDTLELQRSVANENSRFNAQAWRAQNGFEALNILSRGDSTQQVNCPQGDGWASVDLIHATSKQPVLKLKCSTVSANIGCLKDEDFKGRQVFASQENKCNTQIPKNLKKIEQ